MHITWVMPGKYTSFIKKDQTFIWFGLVYIVYWEGVLGVHILLLKKKKRCAYILANIVNMDCDYSTKTLLQQPFSLLGMK